MYCSHYALLICAMIDGLIPVHAEQLYVHVPDQALKLSINRCLHFPSIHNNVGQSSCN